jgi:hypothetical protein
MIISGGSRSGAKWFSTHFMRTDQGQEVTMVEARGLAGDGVADWFRQMQAISAGTRCINFFYHANLNPRDDEPMTEEQWEKAVDTLEHNLGLDGQIRFVIQHEKNGRPHRHVVWSRIDPDTMTAVSDSKTYAIHSRTADELEKAFGHEPTPRGRGVQGRNPDNWEVFRGKESGINPYDVKTELTALYRQADTGPAFAAALEANGYILAKGDRRDFVVIDQGGDEHSLARRIAGVKAAEIRTFLAGIERDALPTVEAARALARERAEARESISEADASRPHNDPAVKREPQPFPDVPTPEPTPFKKLAQDILLETKEVTPATDYTATTAIPEPELSAFERFVQGSKESLRAAGEGSFIADGLAWLAEKLGLSSVDPPVADQEPTAFSSFAEEMKQAVRENGGEPAPGFWQRSIDLLAAARDRAVEWVRESAQHFVGLITRNRDRDHESGIER